MKTTNKYVQEINLAVIDGTNQSLFCSIDRCNLKTKRVVRRDTASCIAWPILFIANMVIPLYFGLSLTERPGRLGMLMGACLLLALGWLVCFYKPRIARITIWGSVLTAASQPFPILHALLGLLGVYMLESMGASHVGVGQIDALEAFLLTLFVGIGLLTSALGLGTLLSLVLPKRWMDPSVYQPTWEEFQRENQST